MGKINYLKNIDEKLGKILKVLTNSNLDAVSKTVKPQIISANSRFTDLEDGTIKDNKIYETEEGRKYYLIWDKKGSDDYMNYSKAEEYCKNLNLAGQKDWMLPTLEWLQGIVDYKKYSPAINEVFDCKTNYYWTSTLYADDSDYAWIVNFYTGHVDWSNCDNNGYVRAVRQVFIS